MAEALCVNLDEVFTNQKPFLLRLQKVKHQSLDWDCKIIFVILVDFDEFPQLLRFHTVWNCQSEQSVWSSLCVDFWSSHSVDFNHWCNSTFIILEECQWFWKVCVNCHKIYSWCSFWNWQRYIRVWSLEDPGFSQRDCSDKLLVIFVSCCWTGTPQCNWWVQ